MSDRREPQTPAAKQDALPEEPKWLQHMRVATLNTTGHDEAAIVSYIDAVLTRLKQSEASAQQFLHVLNKHGILKNGAAPHQIDRTLNALAEEVAKLPQTHVMVPVESVLALTSGEPCSEERCGNCGHHDIMLRAAQERKS